MDAPASSRAIMPTSAWKQRFIPLGLGVAMLATVVAAALSPNIGAVPAQVTSQYGTPNGTTSPFPWWIIAVIVVVVAALLLAYLFFARRRRPPAQGARSSAGVSGPPSGASAVPPPPGLAPPSAYTETPEDVGAAMPAVGVGGAVGAGAAGGEPDIDALMAELDKISGEILKKPPKSGTGGSSAGDAVEETPK